MKKYFYLLLLVSVFAMTVALLKWIIPKLRSIAKQPIYEDGPSWHMKKQGTPTMGGVGFIIPICAVLFILSAILITIGDKITSTSLLLSVFFFIANAIIGMADDITKLRRASNGGLTPKQKLALQFVVSIGFLFARNILFNDDTVVYFNSYSINLGIMYYPLAILFILGIINCANLTDGIDGLASSVALSIALSTFLISFDRREDAWIISIITVGAMLGFLVFNINPAKVFMGDTGSLFLGAIAAYLAFSTKSLPGFILICGVYVIEGVSVILQVLYFKIKRKRLFRMAPLHHHFEKIGFDENKICILAMLLTFALALFAYPIIGVNV